MRESGTTKYITWFGREQQNKQNPQTSSPHAILQPIAVLSTLNKNTFIEKISPIYVHGFPLPLMGNENEKQHSPTKTNTNPYKTFTINTYQCIHYDCTKMAPQNT